ncbi:hypothetical protein EB118_25960 [bacterium]|nr:hypothetical protein [bacterium]
MTYTFKKVDGQEKIYEVVNTNDDGRIDVFMVGISESELEIPALVQHHLNFLAQGVTSQANYATKRQSEYPSFAEQFDLLYHGGYDAWKVAIGAIKAKYPKP